MDCTQQMGQTPLTPKLALQRKDPKKRKLARLKSLPTCLESQPATADAKADAAFSLMVKTAVLPPTPQERLALLRSQDSFGGRSTLTQAETRPLGVDVSVKDWALASWGHDTLYSGEVVIVPRSGDRFTYGSVVSSGEKKKVTVILSEDKPPLKKELSPSLLGRLSPPHKSARESLQHIKMNLQEGEWTPQELKLSLQVIFALIDQLQTFGDLREIASPEFESASRWQEVVRLQCAAQRHLLDAIDHAVTARADETYTGR